MIGRKRRFLVAGLFNVAFASFILQILIYFQLLPVALSTLAYQLIIGIAGYVVYGKFVFHSPHLTSSRSPVRYCVLNILLWVLNWLGLRFAEFHDINQNIVALALVVPLAAFSYLIQKYFVFN